MEAMRGGAVVAGAFAAPHHAIPGWPFMNGKQAIRSDITVEDLVDGYPSAVSFLQNVGVVCMKCGEPVWGTLEEAIRRKGLNVEATIAKLGEFLAGGT
ncbi:MAG TPA: hypothetical protein VMX58_08775 [Patescibacteria group bacterium]|nr:hypothetical protein [Patescibacteria group bacterium]